MNVIQFHINNGYYTHILPLLSMPGCLAQFPENKLLDIKSVDKTYILNNNPCTIEIYNTHNKKLDSNKTINANITNIRLLIMQDIVLKTQNLNMSSKLIVTKGNKTLFEILKITDDTQILQQEYRLCKCFRKLLVGDTDFNDDIDGFQQVVKCFESGGL